MCGELKRYRVALITPVQTLMLCVAWGEDAEHAGGIVGDWFPECSVTSVEEIPA